MVGKKHRGLQERANRVKGGGLILPEIDKYLSVKSIGKSEHTKRKYREVLGKFSDVLEGKGIASLRDVDARDIDDFLLMLSNRSERTISLYLQIIYNLFKHYNLTGIAEYIQDLMRGFRPRREVGVYLREEDIPKFLSVIDRDDFEFVVRLMLFSGLRLSEVLSVRYEDFDFNDGVLIVRGKGKKERIAFVDDRTLELARKLVEKNNLRKDEPIVKLGRRWIQVKTKMTARKAGIEYWNRLTPHKLRHTFAIMWIKNKGDLRTLQKLLGHSSLSVTEVYLDFDIKEKRDEYKKIFS
ncbi:hypothetical protein B6U74_05390 [Candidatus Bathyarchaeota archaeon ex4484_205]|nr:MAG: hypothetical protein B6U74_05390 [Candidatus Bathyarchaeota archaeon ex4484_205]